MKKIGSMILIAIGILGTLTSIIALPNNFTRIAISITFLILILAGFFYLLIQEINLSHAWSILRQS